MEKRIAKITDTFLGFEDHGIFTAILDLDYGGSGQGAGTYILGNSNGGSSGGAEHIMRILKACNASSWEKLKGRTIFAIIQDGLVKGLEPLPTEKGQVFMFADVDLWPKENITHSGCDHYAGIYMCVLK